MGYGIVELPHQCQRAASARVACTFAILVLFETLVHVFGNAAIKTAIFADKYIDIPLCSFIQRKSPRAGIFPEYAGKALSIPKLDVGALRQGPRSCACDENSALSKLFARDRG